MFFGIYVLDVVVRLVVLKKEWLIDPVDDTQYMNIFDASLGLSWVCYIFKFRVQDMLESFGANSTKEF